jgi:hypothetical protein
MARGRFRLDEDAVDVGIAIKRGFERTVGSRDKPKPIDGEYLLGVAVWGVVLFVAGSIVGMSWLPALILAALLCWFWPVVLLFGRTDD